MDVLLQHILVLFLCYIPLLPSCFCHRPIYCFCCSYSCFYSTRFLLLSPPLLPTHIPTTKHFTTIIRVLQALLIFPHTYRSSFIKHSEQIPRPALPSFVSPLTTCTCIYPWCPADLPFVCQLAECVCYCDVNGRPPTSPIVLKQIQGRHQLPLPHPH